MRASQQRWPSGSLAAMAILVMTGCAGDGCGIGLEVTPGGFPHDQRVANAGQVRVAQSALDTLEADPAALVSSFLGTGEDVSFEIPPVCGDEPTVCCPDGTPVTPCGPIVIDLVAQAGDLPRLAIDPISGQSRVDITVRARVSTAQPLPVEYFIGCEVNIQSDGNGDFDDVRLDLDLGLVQDETSGTTRIDVITADFSQLEGDDIDIDGSLACEAADWGFVKDFLIGQMEGTVEDMVQGALADQFCDMCPGGSVDECSATAEACEEGVCMRAGTCEHELGLAGRMLASNLGGGNGHIDLYEVAGGYADSEDGGISLGILAGLLPSDVARDRCGPSAEKPPTETIARSDFFAGNVRPDNDEPFGFAVGVHDHQLDLFSWSAYQSGLLCATVGPDTSDLLSSEAVAPFMPSLLDLLHGRTSPLYIGLRPQQPPELVLGPNTFVVNDSTGATEIDQPLVDVRLTGTEVDIFTMVDDQIVRIMTVVADVHLPIGVDVDGEGQLLPVIGETDDLVSNVTVKNSEALIEDPDDLAMIIPSLISVALPALGDSLPALALPALGPLSIEVLPGGITSVEDNSFLAVFGNVAIAPPAMARLDTTASIRQLSAPDRVALRRGSDASVTLDLTGHGTEWTYRVDGGMWAPFTASTQVTVRSPALRLPGRHTIEVAARTAGQPRTLDPTPTRLEVTLYQRPGVPAAEPLARDPRPVPAAAEFHGGGSEGCGCRAASSSQSLSLFALLILAALLGLRRRKIRPRKSLAFLAPWRFILVALAVPAAGMQLGCGDSVKCAGGSCQDGEVERGPTGRWNSLAFGVGDDVLAAAYEESLGDLVFIHIGDGDTRYKVIDGVPLGNLPTYHPDGYRAGIAEAGDDVGAYTSIAASGDDVYISYFDMTNGQLKLAHSSDYNCRLWRAEHVLTIAEIDCSEWTVSVIDSGTSAGERVGMYSSLVIDQSGVPQVAYMANAGGDGQALTSELRYARASSKRPSGPGDWDVTVIDQVDIAETMASEIYDLPQGLGLFASLVLLPDERPVVVYYNRAAGSLMLAEQSGGWNLHAIAEQANADLGMWADALADEDGSVHIVYQDAIGDQLMYTAFFGGAAGAVEIVDDGVRPGESRAHPVGASATLFWTTSAELAVAYQDGATSDMVLTRRVDGQWTRDDLLVGPHLHGFHVSATTEGQRSAVGSYTYDRSIYPPGELEILIDP